MRTTAGGCARAATAARRAQAATAAACAQAATAAACAQATTAAACARAATAAACAWAAIPAACAWAALTFLAVPAASADEAPGAPPDLVVLWSDPQQCVPACVKERLFREAAALFASWGVDLLSSEGLDSAGGHDVRVVLLDQARYDSRGKRILGETHVRPMEHPAVWILVPNVRAMLERTEWGSSPGLFARALARVATHEILHALVPGLDHASHGLMRPGLGARDLTRASVPLNSAFRRALLDGLRQQPRAAAAVLGRP